MRPLKPHLSSGNAENELRIEHNVSDHISIKKTNENVWFSSHFEESTEKLAKACMKNTKSQTRKKHNKPIVFGTCSKSEQAKTIKKEAWNRGPEA